MNRLLVIILLLISVPASATTYLARVEKDGTISQLAELDADNAAVPNDGSCDGCVVVTRDQYAAYQAQLAALNPVQVSIPALVFWNRFTPQEQLAIATAAQQSPAINVWLITALSAGAINLSDPKTKEGLDALVGANLLTSDREAAILTP